MTSGPQPSPRTASLREPTHKVSASAPRLWRVVTLLWGAIFWVAAAVVAIVAFAAPGLDGVGRLAVLAGAVLLAAVPVPWLTVIPRVRYDVHRWEVTDIAIHVRHGWLSRTDEIVPLSRVQTVDSTQGPLMRAFGLRTVTVSTASSHGNVEIAFLDDEVARSTVAHLVAVTAATPEDAT